MTIVPSPADLGPSARPTLNAPGLSARRLVLVLPSIVLALGTTMLSITVLTASPHRVLDWILLVPFSLVMAWECLVVWQLILGAVASLRGDAGQTPLERRAKNLDPVWTGHSRTALVIPIYEEDAAAVFANVRVMLRSLARTGRCDDIDVHVLSDTTTDAVAALERAEWEALSANTAHRVFYRRRASNAGRKAGNIADFFEARGGDYDFAIILDADSLMSGEAMRRLIRLMEESPRVGLIQTVSYAAGRETLFARIQQFAVRLYAPLALRGLDFWQGGEGSYWGHNAILRIAAFHANCRLPVLPGSPPLGGEILCHDVVEAALLVKAGWEARLLPEFDGTWEEIPTNTLDLLTRERRWCQGNLQHLRVLAIPGLRAGNRAHIALGIGGYLTAPLWWGFLLLGAVRACLSPDGGGLGLLAFGLTEPGAAAGWLAAIGIALILLPRILNVSRALLDTNLRRSFGGAGRFLAGATIEQCFWTLLGPVLSLVNAGFVVKTLTGQAVTWDSQSRADRQVGLGEAFRRHAVHVGLGLLLGVVALRTGGWYELWMAPAILGLVLSPALTSLSSRQDLGRLSHRMRLFATVDDIATAPELAELYAERAAAS